MDGSPEEAQLLCQPYPAAMTVERTSETWHSGGGPPKMELLS